jgi:hypothetical protein
MHGTINIKKGENYCSLKPVNRAKNVKENIRWLSRKSVVRDSSNMCVDALDSGTAFGVLKTSKGLEQTTKLTRR